MYSVSHQGKVCVGGKYNLAIFVANDHNFFDHSPHVYQHIFLPFQIGMAQKIYLGNNKKSIFVPLIGWQNAHCLSKMEKYC